MKICHARSFFCNLSPFFPASFFPLYFFVCLFSLLSFLPLSCVFHQYTSFSFPCCQSDLIGVFIYLSCMWRPCCYVNVITCWLALSRQLAGPVQSLCSCLKSGWCERFIVSDALQTPAQLLAHILHGRCNSCVCVFGGGGIFLLLLQPPPPLSLSLGH